jgi:aspartate carbamoyltransferase
MESIKNLSSRQISFIMNTALIFKEKDYRSEDLKDKIFGLLFFEPSTRTCLSFESAIHRLGGKVIKYNSNYSSEKKGESLEDTIKTIDMYIDVFIIRHPEKNIISKIKKFTNKPIINAGDGDGEHPTQALLDLFTILKYYPKYPNKIAFSGDIKYSRTIHSLVYLLNKLCPDIEFYFVCDKLLEPSNELLSSLKKFKICNDLDYIIKFIDVLYVTRLQKERFNGEIIKSYIIDENLIKNSKSKLIILHPLPRNEELSKDLDNNPKSKYFEQVENGIYVRMSIIYNLFE